MRGIRLIVGPYQSERTTQISYNRRRKTKKYFLSWISTHCSCKCVNLSCIHLSILLFFLRENIDLMNDMGAVARVTPNQNVEWALEFRQIFSDHNVSLFPSMQFVSNFKLLGPIGTWKSWNLEIGQEMRCNARVIQPANLTRFVCRECPSIVAFVPRAI